MHNKQKNLHNTHTIRTKIFNSLQHKIGKARYLLLTEIKISGMLKIHKTILYYLPLYVNFDE